MLFLPLTLDSLKHALYYLDDLQIILVSLVAIKIHILVIIPF